MNMEEQTLITTIFNSLSLIFKVILNNNWIPPTLVCSSLLVRFLSVHYFIYPRRKAPLSFPICLLSCNFRPCRRSSQKEPHRGQAEYTACSLLTAPLTVDQPSSLLYPKQFIVMTPDCNFSHQIWDTEKQAFLLLVKILQISKHSKSLITLLKL